MRLSAPTAVAGTARGIWARGGPDRRDDSRSATFASTTPGEPHNDGHDDEHASNRPSHPGFVAVGAEYAAEDQEHHRLNENIKPHS